MCVYIYISGVSMGGVGVCVGVWVCIHILYIHIRGVHGCVWGDVCVLVFVGFWVCVYIFCI